MRIGIPAAVLAIVALMGNGVAAQASTSPGTKSISFQMKMVRTPSGQLEPLGAHVGAVPADDIVTNFCTTQVNNPHESGHNPGAVNVTGTTTCAPYMFTESYLTIELFFDGEDYAYGEHYQADSYFNTTNAQMACQVGNYYAVLDYTIYFGPTWVPDEASGELISSTEPITC
jgi:hypothetical protein